MKTSSEPARRAENSVLLSREHSFRYPAIEAIHSRWLARGPVHAGTPLA